MFYVPSDISWPHKMVWKQQKDHSMYWDVSFSQTENGFTDYWVILLVFSVQSTDQNLNLDVTAGYRVHIIHICTLASTIVLSSAPSLQPFTIFFHVYFSFHSKVFLCHNEKSPHYWQSSFQGISLINRQFALFSRSNNIMLEAVAHRILHVGCACINYFPWRTLFKTTYTIWKWS